MAAIITSSPATPAVPTLEVKKDGSIPDFNGEWRSTGHTNLEAFLASQKFPANLVTVAAKAVLSMRITQTKDEFTVDTNGHSTAYPIASSLDAVSGHPLENIMYWQDGNLVSRSGDVTGELVTTRSIRARSSTPSAPTDTKPTDAVTSSAGVVPWQLPIGEQEMVLTMTNQSASATRYFARLSSSLPPVVRLSREEEVVYGDEEAAKMQSEVLAELTRK